MEASFLLGQHLDKAARYEAFAKLYKALAEGEPRRMSLLANTSAALREAFHYFWVGFYLVDGDELVLGPFQGTVACSRIKKGKGVCGTAWEQRTIQLVPDVEQFPGHIACSSASRSEIVLPIFNRQQEVIGVLDIDSDKINDFDETDRQGLQTIVNILQSQMPEK